MAKYENILDAQYQFPSRDVSESEKDQSPYNLDYTRAIFSRYVNDKGGVCYGARENMDLIRLYGKGSQPISIYKAWYEANASDSSDSSILSAANSGKTRQGWENISKRVISPLPRIRTVIKGYLDQIGQDVFVDAIDPLSNDMKNNSKVRMFTIAQNYEFINEYHTKAGIPMEELEFLPVSQTELNLYEAMGGFKMNYARAMEKLIKHTEAISEVDDFLKDEWVDDAVDLGAIAARIVYDPNIRKYKYRYCDPKYLAIQYIRENDYSRSEWAGYEEPYTISELKQIMPNKDEEYFRNIAHAYSGKGGNKGGFTSTEAWDNYSKHKNSAGATPYDDFTVDVFEAEWIDYEVERNLIYTSKNNHKSVKRLGKDSEISLTENQKKRGARDLTTKMRRLRGAKIIIGTDVVFDYGLVNMTDRPKQTEVMHSFRLFTIKDLPITEQLIPIADDMALAWYRWQDDRAQLQRAGYAVDVGMMENIDNGSTDFGFLEVLQAWRDTRYLFHQQSLSGKYEGGGISPVQEIPSMMRAALEEFIMTWEAALKRIEDVTGINLVLLGASAGANAQVGTTQMSAASAIYVLKPIINTVSRMKNELAETAIRRLQLAFKTRSDIAKGYADVIGDNDVEILRMAEKDAVQYGFVFENKPTQQMKSDLIAAASSSLQARRDGKPGIDISQFMYIAQQLESGGNMKELSSLLDFLNVKSEQKIQANKEKDIQMQNQGLQQMKQQEQQGKERDTQMQTQGSIAEIDRKGQWDLRAKMLEKQPAESAQGAV